MSRTNSRWTDGSMDARVRKRYAAERRFRFMGFLAIGLSVAFLAFLLVTMAWKGIGGFSHTEARVTIDFPRSDLILDPAALEGPEAQQTIASANLEDILSQAAVASYGEAATELFGGSAARALGRQLIEDPSLLTRRSDLWLPVGSAVVVAATGDGDDASETLASELRARASLKRRFNLDFLTASDATDPSVVGVWGALKGSFLTTSQRMQARTSRAVSEISGPLNASTRSSSMMDRIAFRRSLSCRRS